MLPRVVRRPGGERERTQALLALQGRALLLRRPPAAGLEGAQAELRAEGRRSQGWGSERFRSRRVNYRALLRIFNTDKERQTTFCYGHE